MWEGQRKLLGGGVKADGCSSHPADSSEQSRRVGIPEEAWSLVLGFSSVLPGYPITHATRVTTRWKLYYTLGKLLITLGAPSRNFCGPFPAGDRPG